MALNYDSPLIDNTAGSPTLDSLKSGSDKINGALTEIKEEVNDLGSASLVDTGTAAGDVPLNSDLGTASTKDTGTAAGEVPLNSDLGSASLVDAIGSGDLYGRDSILGTVSETAGVPTGAIIESGSNSDGEYTRWADGTQQVNQYLEGSWGGSGNQIYDVSWTYPIGFINTPEYQSAMAGGNSSNDNNCLSDKIGQNISNGTVDSTETLFTVVKTGGTSIAGNLRVIAIGRWFN